jgi:hypothetical protein
MDDATISNDEVLLPLAMLTGMAWDVVLGLIFLRAMKSVASGLTT